MAQTPEKPAAPATPAAPTPAAEAPCVSAKSQLKAVKSERAELNVATKAKEEDPSPTRLDALRDEGAKVIADVRAKAVEVAELAAVKAETAKVRAVESVHSLKSKAGQMRQSAVAFAPVSAEHRRPRRPWMPATPPCARTVCDPGLPRTFRQQGVWRPLLYRSRELLP